MSATYTCNHCNEDFDIFGLAYLGPEDRDSNYCNPFMSMIAICYDCESHADIETNADIDTETNTRT